MGFFEILLIAAIISKWFGAAALAGVGYGALFGYYVGAYVIALVIGFGLLAIAKSMK